MLHAFIKNWKERHTTLFNRALHALGIPLVVLAIIPLILGKWLAAALFFLIGYALQFIGHAREGSEVGELLWIKHLFKK